MASEIGPSVAAFFVVVSEACGVVDVVVEGSVLRIVVGHSEEASVAAEIVVVSSCFPSVFGSSVVVAINSNFPYPSHIFDATAWRTETITSF